MEIKGATFLFTLAGLMVTFAGFSALLFGLRQAAGATLSRLDRFIAKTIIAYNLVLVAGALLPSMLALYAIEDTWIWRISALLYGLPMLALQVSYPQRRRHAVGKGPPAGIYAIFVVLGSVVTLAMLCYVLAGLRFSVGVYISALTINFFTVAYGFLSALDIVMQQPNESPRPPPSK